MQRLGTTIVKTLARTASVVVLLSGLLLVDTTPAFADHIQTPEQLRDACERSVDHVVVLNHPTKIFTVGQTTPLPVASGCTIVVGINAAKLEAEYVPLRFAGPLVIQAAQKTEVKLVKSWFSAPSITINLTGSSSAFAASESTLEATSGDLLISFGEESKLEIVNRLLPGPANGLSAAGVIRISVGRKFSGLIDENNIYGAQGIAINLNGEDSLLKMTQLFFSAPQGAIAVTALGAKSLLDLSESRFDMRDGVAVRMLGNDAALALKQTVLGRSDGSIAPNGVVIEAGAGAALNGKVELAEISIFDVASVTIRATPLSLKGVLKLEKSTISATGDIIMETGGQGTTAVKENQLVSATRIRIATGANGSCLAQPNSFGATPIVEACP